MSTNRHIRRHGPVYLVTSAPEGSVPEIPTPTPMQALIAQSVEGSAGHDPNSSGEGTDTEEGFRLDLFDSGGVMTNPQEGIAWSIPMVNQFGERITEVPTRVPGGWIRIEEVERPEGFADPSNLCLFAGWTSDGPIETAGSALVFGLRNTDAGSWRLAIWYKTGGTWTQLDSSLSTELTTGLHGSWGADYLLAGQLYGITAINLPNPAGAYSRAQAMSLLMAGSDPHFVFGGGWAAAPTDNRTAYVKMFGFFGDDPDAILAGV